MLRLLITFFILWQAGNAVAQNIQIFDLYKIKAGYRLESCIDYVLYNERLYIPDRIVTKVGATEKVSATKNPLVILGATWDNGCLKVEVDPDPTSIKKFLMEITTLNDNQIFLNIKP